MIIKKKLLNYMLCVGFVYNCFGQNQNKSDSNFIVERLDISPKVLNKKYAIKPSFEYTLDNDVSCYVVNETQFSNFESNNLLNYLKNGGVIIINQKEFSGNDIQKYYKIDNFVIESLDTSQSFGTILFHDIESEKVKVISYGIDYLIPNYYTNDGVNSFKTLVENWLSSINIEDILNKIISLIKGWIENSKGNVEIEETQKDSLGTASCIQVVSNILNPKEIICSYQIDAEILQG